MTATTHAQRSAARAKFGLAASDRVVAILPGSRRQELRCLLDAFLEAASKIGGARFLLPVSDPCYEPAIRAAIARHGMTDRVRLVDRDSHDALRACDVALTASGTATLEATLLGIPMVVAYRVSALTLFIVRAAIRLGLMDAEITALPNLVLGRGAVTELKQRDVEPLRIASEVRQLLDDELARHKMVRDLGEAAAKVRAHDSAGRVADFVLGRRTAQTGAASR